MPQFFTDFTEYDLEVMLPDWTARWRTGIPFRVVEDIGATGGVALRVGNGPAVITNEFYSWDIIPPVTDADFLYRWRAGSQHASGINGGVAVRASGPYEGEYGYVCGNYYLDWRRRNISKIVDGVTTLLDNGTYTLLGSSDVYKWTRFRVSGSTLQMRSWPDDATEPVDWDLSVTDSELTSAGWVGIFRNLNSNSVYYDFFAVGTDGDLAPMGPPDGPSPADPRRRLLTAYRHHTRIRRR